jgi:hypothetical protein
MPGRIGAREGIDMAGSFTSGRFRFQVEGSDWETDAARGFREAFQEDAFDLRLTDTGKVPDLGGAPIASWLLARLARLTDDRLGLAGVEDADGGGYMVEFVVYRLPAAPDPMQPLLFNMDEVDSDVVPDSPVASFQFQADMEGAAVLGHRAADCTAEEVLDALATALLAAPADLMPRELSVRDPEWELDPEMYRPRPEEGSCNWYGWDGFVYLGKDNITGAE